MIGWPISRFLSFPISFLFPGYKSFHAVMSEGSSDDTRWLSYWLICGFLFFFESACSILVEYFPFYFELKCVFLLFLQYDSARPAFRLYMQFLGPILKRAEPHVDRFLAAYSQQAVAIQHKAQEEAAKQVLKATLNQ